MAGKPFNPNPGVKKRLRPGLQVPQLPPGPGNLELMQFLGTLAEYVEQGDGNRGQPEQRFVTIKDLKDAGISNFIVKNRRAELGSDTEEAKGSIVTGIAAAAASAISALQTLFGLADTHIDAPKDEQILTYIAATQKWENRRNFVIPLGLTFDFEGTTTSLDRIDSDFEAIDLLWFTNDDGTDLLSTEPSWSAPRVSDGLIGDRVLRHQSALSHSFFSILVPVDINEDYFLSVYARQGSSTPRNRLFVAFYDEDGDLINSASTPISDAVGWSSTVLYHFIHASLAFNTAPTFTRHTFTFGASGTGTIPTGAVSMRIGGQINTLPSVIEEIDLQEYRLQISSPVRSAQGGVEIVSQLPTLPDSEYPINSLVMLTTDSKLYRNVADVWTSAVATGDINIAAQGWTYDAVFSATDLDTVAWATGTLTTSDAQAFSITGANTGNMAARTFIYLDIAVSTTAFQTTTTAATAVGDGKILVAVAENEADQAFFQVFGGIGGTLLSTNQLAANSIVANTISAGAIIAGKIDADAVDTLELVADSVTTAKINAGAVTATEMNVASLSAISADIGSITAGTIVVTGTIEGTIGLVGVLCFTPTWDTGFSTDPTGTFDYLDMKNFAMVWAPADRLGTADAAFMGWTASQVPSAIRPAAARLIIHSTYPGIDATGQALFATDGSVTFSSGLVQIVSPLRHIHPTNQWNTSGSKGLKSGTQFFFPL